MDMKKTDLRFSVVLTKRFYEDEPDIGGRDTWAPWSEDAEIKWGAVLTPDEFHELVQRYWLYPECHTMGTLGAPGFLPHHLVPAYSFKNEDEDYDCYVTPWTEEAKEEAEKEVEPPQPVPVLNNDMQSFSQMNMACLPLWGDRWADVEEQLVKHYENSGTCGCPDEPLREITLKDNTNG